MIGLNTTLLQYTPHRKVSLRTTNIGGSPTLKCCGMQHKANSLEEGATRDIVHNHWGSSGLLLRSKIAHPQADTTWLDRHASKEVHLVRFGRTKYELLFDTSVTQVELQSNAMNLNCSMHGGQTFCLHPSGGPHSKLQVNQRNQATAQKQTQRHSSPYSLTDEDDEEEDELTTRSFGAGFCFLGEGRQRSLG